MNHRIFQPSGLLDGQRANHLRREIADAISEGINIIRVDFQEVTFINSSAIGALVAALKMVKVSGGEILLYSLNDQVKMIFELTKMDQVFRISTNRIEIDEKIAVIN